MYKLESTPTEKGHLYPNIQCETTNQVPSQFPYLQDSSFEISNQVFFFLKQVN